MRKIKPKSMRHIKLPQPIFSIFFREMRGRWTIRLNGMFSADMIKVSSAAGREEFSRIIYGRDEYEYIALQAIDGWKEMKCL